MLILVKTVSAGASSATGEVVVTKYDRTGGQEHRLPDIEIMLDGPTVAHIIREATKRVSEEKRKQAEELAELVISAAYISEVTI